MILINWNNIQRNKMAKVTLQRSRLIKASGNFHQVLYDYAIEAKVNEVPSKIEGIYHVFFPSDEFLPLAFALGVHSLIDYDAGENFEEFPLYIEIGSPSDDVPAGMIGSEDEEGNPVTWQDWVLPNKPVHSVDGRHFVGSYSHTGSYLRIVDMLPVLDDLVLPSDIPVSE